MLEEKQEITQKVSVFDAIISLVIEKRAFIRCPYCAKNLGWFEIYNENCSFCGKIDKDSMFVMASGLEKDDNEINDVKI